jgi:predicted GNAT family N-acyltransferase
MQLVKRSLESRAFLIQFGEVMREFGQEIPWLEGLENSVFWTNAAKFRSELLKKWRCEDGQVVAYQFILPGEEREYAGGIIHFSHSPEVFKDRSNQQILERFEAEGYHFISCLQVRSTFRSQGHGHNMTTRALKSIQAKYPKIWGVVSDYHLIAWYQKLGGQLLSPLDNSDNLWTISWS